MYTCHTSLAIVKAHVKEGIGARAFFVKFEESETHFVGASCSSISPLMKVAMLPAAALVSSAVLEMVSLLRSSSRTFSDLAFSAFVVAAFEGAASMMSAEGMLGGG